MKRFWKQRACSSLLRKNQRARTVQRLLMNLCLRSTFFRTWEETAKFSSGLEFHSVNMMWCYFKSPCKLTLLLREHLPWDSGAKLEDRRLTTTLLRDKLSSRKERRNQLKDKSREEQASTSSFTGSQMEHCRNGLSCQISSRLTFKMLVGSSTASLVT